MERPRRRLALGLVETRGFVASVEAADAMTKAAHVELVRQEVARGARITVLVRGGLADVEAAVAAGAAAASRVGECLRSHTIPAPDASIEAVLGLARAAREPKPRRT